MKKIPILCLLAVVLFSCKKESLVSSDPLNDTADISALDVFKKGIVVGGDMLILPTDAQTSNRSVVVNVSGTGYTPLYAQYQRGIRVKLKQYGVIQGNLAWYSDALDKAIFNWNALLPRSNISFDRVGVNDAADVELCAYDFGAPYSWGGLSMLSTNGKPAKYVYLNDYYLRNWPNANVLSTLITHELGHVIGFAHCDDPNPTSTSYMAISGVPASSSVTGSLLTVPWTSAATNPNSIMNSGEGYGEWTQSWSNYLNITTPCGFDAELAHSYTNLGEFNRDGTYQNKGFTYADIEDIQYIYPYFPKTVASTRPNSGNSRYYTVDYVAPNTWMSCWKITKVVSGSEIEFTSAEYAAGWVPYTGQTFGGLSETEVVFPTNTSGQSFTIRLRPTMYKMNQLVSENGYGIPSYIDIYVP